MQLFGCGGGGNDGNGELSYTGNTSPTAITPANASRLVGGFIANASVMTGVPLSVIITSAPSRTQGVQNILPNLAQYLTDSISNIVPNVAQPSTRVPRAVQVDDIEYCTVSGSIHYTGTINDNGTGTLNVSYNDCLEDSMTMNGSATFTIYTFDMSVFVPTDMLVSFGVFTVTGPGYNLSMGGQMRIQLDNLNAIQTLTADLVFKDNMTGRMQKTENLVFVTLHDYSSYPYTATQIFNGRLYDSIDGYLDIITEQALFYENLQDNFTFDSYASNGRLLFTGASSAHLRVLALSNIELLIELDLDNDGAYEISGILPWLIVVEAAMDPNDADGDGMPDNWEALHGLNNQTYVDFGEDGDGDGLTNFVEYISGTLPNDSDTDDDGMPDGWELDYGFMPTDSLDAIEDADGEGASNLDEYLAGTDPLDASSAPADLSITINDLIDPVSVGTNFSYLLSVTNNGPGSASNIEVLDTLPASTSYYSATGDRWSCTHVSGTVTCTRGSFPADVLAVGATSTITVVTTAPVNIENLSNSASVSSAIPDIVLANNNASMTTQLTDPILTFVEAQIDDVNMLNGLNAKRSVTISPDGNHIYTTRFPDDAISVFSRDATTGELTFVEIQQDGVNGVDSLDGPTSAAVSGDGEHVYVTSSFGNSLVVFSRDVSTGALTIVESHKDGLNGVVGLALASTVTVSPDGAHVYTTGMSSEAPTDRWAVTVFARNAITGSLTFVEVLRDGIDGVQIGWQPKASISPDGNHLYVATIHENLSSDGAISLFSRDASTGVLSFVDVYVDGSNGISGIDSASSISISSDGTNVYVTGQTEFASGEGTVVTFSRDSLTGALDFIGVHVNDAGGIFGLDYASSVDVSPNGKYVYITSPGENALAVFDRDATTGTLKLVEVQTDDLSGVDGLANAYSVVVSPDDNHVYATGLHNLANPGDKSVAVFSVNPRPTP